MLLDRAPSLDVQMAASNQSHGCAWLRPDGYDANGVPTLAGDDWRGEANDQPGKLSLCRSPGLRENAVEVRLHR